MLSSSASAICWCTCLQDEGVLAAVLQQLTDDGQLTRTGLGVLAELLHAWAADDASGMAALLESSPAARPRLQQLCVWQAQQQQQSGDARAPFVAAAALEACLAAAGSQPAELVKAFHAVAEWLHLLPSPMQYQLAKDLLARHMDLTVKLLKLELKGPETQHLQRRVALTILANLRDTAAMPARAANSALDSLGSWALWKQISVANLHSAPVVVADLLREALLPALQVFVANPGMIEAPLLSSPLRQAVLQLQKFLAQGKDFVLRCPCDQRHQAVRLLVSIADLLMTAHKAKLWRAARNKALPAELKELQQAAFAFGVPAAALEQLRGILGGASCSREPAAKSTRQITGLQPDRSPITQPEAQSTMVTNEPAVAVAGAAGEAPAIVAQPGKQASKDAEVLAGAVAGAAGADLQPQSILTPKDPAELMKVEWHPPATAAAAGAAVEAPAILAQPGKQASKDPEVLAGAVAGAAGADLQPQSIFTPEDPPELMEVDWHPPATAACHFKPSPVQSFRDALMSQRYYCPQ